MKFSKALRHIDIGDVKKKHLQKESAKIKEEKQKKEFRQYLVSTMETKKYSWREGMTTGNSFSSVLSAEGETAIDQVNPSEITNFSNTDSFLPGNNAALKAATIRSNGSGSGSTGGFNVGGDYLAFQGTSAGDGSRHAILKPIDATNVDTITITAIRGTGSNGGEHPDVVGTEELFIRYKTPDMSTSQYLSFDRSGNAVGSFPDDASIIAINQGDGTLQDYTITIPEYARQKDVTFALYQKGHSGSEYDHYGVTDIKFQRKTPMTVFVPLDSPAASSFIRSAPPSSTPKKRKKDVDDKLEASDEYTSATFGNDFPGREVRVGGEDPFASAKIGDDVEPSPQGKDEVKKAFGATELKTALGRPAASKKADPEGNLTNIVKSGKAKSEPVQSKKSLTDFEDAKKEQQITTQVKKNVNNEIEKSPEVNNLVTKITNLYSSDEVIDALKSNLDPVGKIPGVTEIRNKIADVIIDAVADVTQPILDAKTAANTLNSYDDFLGKIVKDPNTPGSSFENPYDLKNDVTKQDIEILQKATTSNEFVSVVNDLKNEFQFLSFVERRFLLTGITLEEDIENLNNHKL